MTKITIKLIISILQIRILRPAMSTNFTQNWREHCIMYGMDVTPWSEKELDKSNLG